MNGIKQQRSNTKPITDPTDKGLNSNDKTLGYANSMF